MAYDTKNLGTGEKIVYYAHRHIIVLIKNAIQWILLFFVALVVTIFVLAWKTNPGEAIDVVRTVALLGALVAMFVSVIAFLIAFLLWKTEEYIITNERIIRVEGIINKNETATALDKVNDVETHQSLLGRMLGYGNVMIQTGSDQGINQLDYLAQPQEFKKVMLNAKNKHYGDASDLAPRPGGGRYEDEEEYPRRSRQGERVYDAPPQSYSQGRVYDAPPPRSQAPYPQQGQYYDAPAYPVQPQQAYPANDPRGYVPRPQPGYASQNQNQAHMSPAQIAEAIQQLARLRDSGVISEAEFQAKKQDLMNRM